MAATVGILLSCRRAGAVALWLVCACGYFSNWVKEFQSPTVTGDRFTSVILLLGTRDQASANLADQVERRLGDSGLTVLPRPGRWRNEAEALEEVCAGASSTVDGLLFVWPDRLKLWDCRTRLPAYEIQSESARADELVNRLVRYLRDQPR